MQSIRHHSRSTLWPVPSRSDETELLDTGAGSLADVRTNLDEMWRLNTLFGGLRALTCHLHPPPSSTFQPLHIVDVGTGSGRLPLHLVGWARKHQLQLQVYPLDISGRNLAVARANIGSHPAIHPVQADGLALPFAPQQIDYFMSSLVLHHFPPEALVSLLRETFRLARRGIIMSDIVRGYLPLAAFRLIQPIFARHYLTRRDGITSIKRAYTAHELTELAREAGLSHARVVAHFPWRMTLVVAKPDV